MACAIGWVAACAACLALAHSQPEVVRLSAPEKAITIFAFLAALALIVMKIAPTVPGHFTLSEWLALAVWCLLGTLAAAAK